jgi:ankyrin repeat protein
MAKVLVEGGTRINAIGMFMSAFPVPYMLSWTIDKNHRTALHNASANGHPEVVKVLLKHGRDVKAIGISLDRFPCHLNSEPSHRQGQ